jgi:hypothetical protein
MNPVRVLVERWNLGHVGVERKWAIELERPSSHAVDPRVAAAIRGIRGSTVPTKPAESSWNR